MLAGPSQGTRWLKLTTAGRCILGAFRQLDLGGTAPSAATKLDTGPPGQVSMPPASMECLGGTLKRHGLKSHRHREVVRGLGDHRELWGIGQTTLLDLLHPTGRRCLTGRTRMTSLMDSGTGDRVATVGVTASTGRSSGPISADRRLPDGAGYGWPGGTLDRPHHEWWPRLQRTLSGLRVVIMGGR